MAEKKSCGKVDLATSCYLITVFEGPQQGEILDAGEIRAEILLEIRLFP